MTKHANTAEKLSIIGCGNLNRSDDGVGSTVLRRLLDYAPAADPRIALFDAGTAGMEVMFRARGSSKLIIVDACNGGGTPGTLYKVPGEELEAAWQHESNLHSFRWQHALYAGHKIFGDAFPADVDVYLIEAASLDLGLELSPAVESGATKLLSMLQNDIDAWLKNSARTNNAPTNNAPTNNARTKVA